MSNTAPWDSEDDPSEHFDSETEATSKDTSSEPPRNAPTTVFPQPAPIVHMPDPNRPRPRTRQTARKRVAPPVWSGLTINRQDAAGPSRTLPGVLVTRASGMTTEETQRMQALEAKVRECQEKTDDQQDILYGLSELICLLQECMTKTSEKSIAARRTAQWAMFWCKVVTTVLVILVLVLLVVYLEL